MKKVFIVLAVVVGTIAAIVAVPVAVITHKENTGHRGEHKARVRRHLKEVAKLNSH